MEYTKLGSTGMDVSRICLGCMGFGDAERWIHKWVLDEENSRPIVRKALDLGINFFDTANIYSIGKSEEILGRALQDFANRDEVVIATKVHGRMHDGQNGAGQSECRPSQKRLQAIAGALRFGSKRLVRLPPRYHVRDLVHRLVAEHLAGRDLRRLEQRVARLVTWTRDETVDGEQHDAILGPKREHLSVERTVDKKLPVHRRFKHRHPPIGFPFPRLAQRQPG